MSTAMKSYSTASLLITHVVGMIDLVALPVWVGTLVQYYSLDFEQAGLTVTSFLLGVVAASLILAPRCDRLSLRLVAIGGYGTAAAAFFAAAHGAGSANLIALHVIAGGGVGCGLSMTHGAISRSSNPHRLFAIAGTALAGTVSQRLGFGGLGVSAVCVAVVGITCFIRVGRAVRPSPGASDASPAVSTISAG
jgi:MFS family permease